MLITPDKGNGLKITSIASLVFSRKKDIMTKKFISLNDIDQIALKNQLFNVNV